MIVRDGTAIEGAHFADAGISYSCRKISKTEAVERLVVEKQIVTAVADIVCGKNRPTPDRVLNFQIPLHKLSVGEVAGGLRSHASDAPGTTQRFTCGKFVSIGLRTTPG